MLIRIKALLAVLRTTLRLISTEYKSIHMVQKYKCTCELIVSDGNTIMSACRVNKNCTNKNEDDRKRNRKANIARKHISWARIDQRVSIVL